MVALSQKTEESGSALYCQRKQWAATLCFKTRVITRRYGNRDKKQLEEQNMLQTYRRSAWGLQDRHHVGVCVDSGRQLGHP